MNFLLIESLRKGIPPQRGVEKYSIGNKRLIEGIRKFHLSQLYNVGKIRFICGSWGSGKTHLFRLIREFAFQENAVVSNVDLSMDTAPFNKFEKVFYSIVRNILTPISYHDEAYVDITPFRRLIEESLCYLSGVKLTNNEKITPENLSLAIEKLMENKGIDIDFKKMISHYWKSCIQEEKLETTEKENTTDQSSEIKTRDQIQEEILQWFAGEGTISSYRDFKINKIIKKENAKLMLQSLTEFIKLSGYKGIVILFDEAEQSYSIMRKSARKDAYNNLLSLINNIENIPGMFLIYATTPDFYIHEKHGIKIYGALSQRIGMPEDKQPLALDMVWNLDKIHTDLTDYQEAAKKIRKVYLEVFPNSKDSIMDENATLQFVKDLEDGHSEIGTFKQLWRRLVISLIRKFDLQQEGIEVSNEEINEDFMNVARES